MAAKSGNGGAPKEGRASRILTPIIVCVIGLAILGGGFWAANYGRNLKQANEGLGILVEKQLVESIELKERIADLTREENKTVLPLIQRLRPQLDPSIAKEINVAVIKYSVEYRIPPEFIVYLMKRESMFSPLAKSKAGALGLMQILPKYHKDKMKKMGITANQVYHIDNNIRLGAWILRDYYNQTGSIEKALTKYVGGTHKSYVDDILVGFANEMIPKKERDK